MTDTEKVKFRAKGGSSAFKNLFKQDNLGIIDNPFSGVTLGELDKNARWLHENAKGLEDVVSESLLIRGGRLAYDPELFMEARNSGLDDVERKALKKESTSGLWQQNKELKTILLTCCVAAVVQGWDQASITGANLQWPNDFGMRVSLDKEGYALSHVWIFGGVNAISFFAAASVGAWLSDPLNEFVYGRRGALFVAGLFSFVGVIASAFTHSWQALFACRFLVGIGMGAKASVVPILEAEVAPPRLRGRLLVSWQTFTAAGIFLGSAANLILHGKWRWQTACGFIPAFLLLALVFVCSESPRWLIKQDRYKDAYIVLLRLREVPLLAARDLYRMHAQIQVETAVFARKADAEMPLGNKQIVYQTGIKKTNYATRIWQLFAISRNRRAAVASFCVMAAQQMSGINIFAFLAASLFSEANFTEMQSLSLALGFGAANFVFSPIAYWFIDTKGRRFLLLLSLFCCMPTLIATGFSFDINSSSPKDSTRIGVVAFFLMFYTLCYSPGAGVVPFLYSSEIFPLVNREVGMSWACFWNFFLAGLLALTVPQLIHSLGHPGLLCLFAGLDSIAFILVWLFVPSPRPVPSSPRIDDGDGDGEGGDNTTPIDTHLEDMNGVFGVSTRRHIKYQVSEVLPWVWDSMLRRKRARRPRGLYRWDRNRNRDVDLDEGGVVGGGDGEGGGVEMVEQGRRGEGDGEDRGGGEGRGMGMGRGRGGMRGSKVVEEQFGIVGGASEEVGFGEWQRSRVGRGVV